MQGQGMPPQGQIPANAIMASPYTQAGQGQPQSGIGALASQHPAMGGGPQFMRGAYTQQY